jgi:hypothetical protein
MGIRGGTPMKYRRGFTLTIAMVCSSVLAFAADVAGTWTAEIETPAGIQKMTLEFTHEGGQIAGNITTEQMGKLEIKEGKLEEGAISFVQVANLQDKEVRYEYKGTVSGDEIKFSRQGGEAGTQEFVAKRVK